MIHPKTSLRSSAARPTSAAERGLGWGDGGPPLAARLLALENLGQAGQAQISGSLGSVPNPHLRWYKGNPVVASDPEFEGQRVRGDTLLNLCTLRTGRGSFRIRTEAS